MATNSPFNILSLSGGGYLGLFSAYVLTQLEEHTGQPIGRSFDLVAGTSIGGILALAIAFEVPMKDVLAAFQERGTEIFSRREAARGILAKALDVGRGLLSPKYRQTNLRQVITDLLDEKIIGEALHPVIVPAVNLSKGAPQVFKTPHLEKYERDWRIPAVDVALATSAAPTYFPLAKIGAELFADGGLFANSPDLLAVHEAEHFMSVPRALVAVLSIGTTTASFAMSHRAGQELGALQWMSGQRLVSTLLSSQQRMVHDLMGHMLGNRYKRIDHTQSKEQESEIGLDVAGPVARETILSIAEGAVRAALGEADIRAILQHKAARVQFAHGPRKATTNG